MVALDDDTMKKAFDSMKSKYKNVQFRSCGVNLGKKGTFVVVGGRSSVACALNATMPN